MHLLPRAAVAALIVSLVPSLALAAPSAKVINGRDAASSEPGASSIVAVGTAGARSAWDAFNCGGTLVAPLVVVTARHCVDESPFITDARTLVVFRGTGPSLDMPTKGWAGVETTKVISIHRSPGDNDASFARGGDIAILRLVSPLPSGVPIGYVHPGDEAWFAPRSTGVTLMGWGATVDYNERTGEDAGGYPTKLQTVAFPIVSSDTCLKGATMPSVAVNYLCAGVAGTPATARSSCYGDSGGPLFASSPAGNPDDPLTERRLVGVVSHGDDDRCGGAYTRYTRVDTWASWIDGFVAGAANAPSNTAAPTIASARRSGARALKIVPGAVTSGPAPTRLLVTVGNGGGKLLQAGTVGPNGGTIGVPPTRSGKLTLMLRALDAAGNESAASAPKVVPTAKDRTKPRIARASARPVGGGRWIITWSRATDDDRVVDVLIERRRPGTTRWHHEWDVECLACWTKLRSVGTRSLHWGLPGKWQFRLTAFDRAGNASVPVIAR